MGPKKLEPAEEKLVEELAQIDRKVRAHEAAHQAAAGSLGGAVSFTYETGPDGKSYAVGGEVPIVISSGRTPEETMARAEQVRAAALAPVDPSPQDLAVAAQASEMEAQARQQMAQLQAAPARPTDKQARPHTEPPEARRDSPQVHLGPDGNAKVRDRQSASSENGQAPRAIAAVPTSAPSSSRLDVSSQAATAIAALESQRASQGATVARLQQLARLAAAAYRM